jgi:hypothetical protein
MSKRRILCPFHSEKTPSCMLYEDGYHCMSCGKYGPLSEIRGVEVHEIKDPEPEDLRLSLERIRQLPTQVVRGLRLHADAESFYIVWPDSTYYKRRFFADRKPKYLGAQGHNKGPFWAQKVGSRALIVVEGELNALSIAEACPELDVMSPGGSGDFAAGRVKKYLRSMTKYDILYVLADADKAGALACIEFLGAVQGKVKAKHHLMATDANELLQGVGIGGLRQAISQVLEEGLEALAEGRQVSVQ